MDTLIETPALDSPYQILNHHGQLVGDPPNLTPEKLLSLHEAMWRTRLLSDKIVAMQRQGRAATFGPLVGQEASAVGVGAPLKPQDWMAGSYREIGAYMAKGVKVQDFLDVYRGFPPPKGADGANCLPIQIVIGTQVLHAVGLAMAARIKGDDAIAVGICGDGATSEGDVNEALNFAGVFKAPAIIVFTNNGWAISMPRSQQTSAPTLAARGIGFGVPSKLVDGNDILAVYKTTSEAAERARAGDGPTLIELLTYRMGAHTTADDPTRYRPKEELEYWKERDPISRFRKYLFERNILDEKGEKQMTEAIETEINEAVEFVEKQTPLSPDAIFDMTFEQPTPRLQRQRAMMRRELDEIAAKNEGRA